MLDNIVGINVAIFIYPTTWKASDHVDAFNNLLIDNKNSKKCYCADVLIEEHIEKNRQKINKEVEKTYFLLYLSKSKTTFYFNKFLFLSVIFSDI